MSDTDMAPVQEGTEVLLESTWLVPPWIPVALLLLAALLVGWLYRTERGDLGWGRRLSLAVLRWIAMATLVLMLYGWTLTRHRTDLPDLVLALDVSTSMTLEDHYPPGEKEQLSKRTERTLSPGAVASGPTRLAIAQTAMLENDGRLLAELKERYHVRVVEVGNVARPVETTERTAISELEAHDETSRLGSCLRGIMESQRGRPTAAVVLFTDGVTTEGLSLVEGSQLLRRKGIPLYVVGLGSDVPQRDLRLTEVLVDEAAFVNDLVNFEVRVAAAGFEGNATVRLKDVKEGKTLAETQVSFQTNRGPLPVHLNWRPVEKGEYEFVIEVEPVEGEVNLENNRLNRSIRVSDPKLKVLLVQSGPSFEFRFLKSLLERELNHDGDAKLEDRGFHSILQEADKEYVETDKSALRLFPATREALFAYDVLIFGDVNPEFLTRTALENIAAFVTERGGGLIVYAGPRFTPLSYRDTPLAEVLPIRLEAAFVPDSSVGRNEAFRPRITPLGAAFPGMQLADSPVSSLQIWEKELNSLHWYLAAPELRSGVRVLAEHPSKTAIGGQPLPIICQQYVGAGKVIFHATDETHRWRFRDGEKYFSRYWVQTIRTLARSRLGEGQGVELTTDKPEYQRGEAVNFRLRFLDERLAPPVDDGVTLLVEHAGAQRRTIDLRRGGTRAVFEGAATNLPEGEYRAWIATPALENPPAARRFAIAAPPGEFARLEADVAGMREAAKVSRGRYYAFNEAARLADDLPKGRQVRIEALPPEPIWNSPYLAAWFVLVVSAEWLLRKRWGLP